jgi:glycosyltransferase involved in cell wall biosynthesis
MRTDRIAPENTEFVILSFEGPDLYSLAGGLGVRVTNLAQTLACHGFHTHLFFIGDPYLPGCEYQLGGKLVLHRWCQWISKYHPLGVYDGEEGKLGDYSSSVPGFICQEIARKAAFEGRQLVVLAEDWQTVESLCNLSDELHKEGLRQYSALIWNANNTMGFDRLDWTRLSFLSTVTTVSRYMKQLMRLWNQDPLVIPNGIPSTALTTLKPKDVAKIRNTLGVDGRPLFFKVGRFDPAKCWTMAVEAAACLKERGEDPILLMRGGIEAHGIEVFEHARARGLQITDVEGHPENWKEALELIRSADEANLYNLRFFMSQEMLRPFYAAVDVVLANSKHEPFGLVGLEAMAAGGIVFTGPTGETYSVNGDGALSLDTETAEEIVLNYMFLREHPVRAQEMRAAAPKMAARYTWEKVLLILFEKIELAKCQQETVIPWRSVQLSVEEIKRPAGKKQKTRLRIYERRQERRIFRDLEVDQAFPV